MSGHHRNNTTSIKLKKIRLLFLNHRLIKKNSQQLTDLGETGTIGRKGVVIGGGCMGRSQSDGYRYHSEPSRILSVWSGGSSKIWKVVVGENYKRSFKNTRILLLPIVLRHQNSIPFIQRWRGAVVIKPLFYQYPHRDLRSAENLLPFTIVYKFLGKT